MAMTAIHLHLKSDVGTTYKRALKRFHQFRDCAISRDIRALRLIEAIDNWFVLTQQRGRSLCANPEIYDAELKALNDKARQLKTRKQSQLGELVIACGADALNLEELAGALLVAASTTEAARREAWRKRGAAFFQGSRSQTGAGTGGDQGGTAPDTGSSPSSTGTTGAA